MHAATAVTQVFALNAKRIDRRTDSPTRLHPTDMAWCICPASITPASRQRVGCMLFGGRSEDTGTDVTPRGDGSARVGVVIAGADASCAVANADALTESVTRLWRCSDAECTSALYPRIGACGGPWCAYRPVTGARLNALVGTTISIASAMWRGADCSERLARE